MPAYRVLLKDMISPTTVEDMLNLHTINLIINLNEEDRTKDVVLDLTKGNILTRESIRMRGVTRMKGNIIIS